MASSDNVVRSGLTPKFKDVDTLVEMLTYTSVSARKQIMHPTLVSPGVQEYDPPIAEFTVLRLSAGASVGAHDGPGILLVTSGRARLHGTQVAEGSVWFLPAGTAVSVTESDGFEAFLAFCQV